MSFLLLNSHVYLEIISLPERAVLLTFSTGSTLLIDLSIGASGKRYFFSVQPLSLSIFRLRREMRYCDALVMILG